MLTHPEVESVPRLLLRIDAVDLGPADSPDIGLVALFKVDELQGTKEQQWIKTKNLSLSVSAHCTVVCLTSSPICGTKGERLGMVSIIQDGGNHSSASSPPRDDGGF